MWYFVLVTVLKFYPTFLCGERRTHTIWNRILAGISIHVPAWGTTTQNVEKIRTAFISIHVPAWGTTIKCVKCGQTLIFQSTFPRGERPAKGLSGATKDVGFQSTFPRGERLSWKMRREVLQNISIHVPAWGTTNSKTKSSTGSIFQSTFPRGERLGATGVQ